MGDKVGKVSIVLVEDNGMLKYDRLLWYVWLSNNSIYNYRYHNYR